MFFSKKTKKEEKAPEAPVTPAPATDASKPDEAPKDDKAPEAQAPAAAPVEIKPANVSLNMSGKMAVVSIRLAGNVLIYNDGIKIHRMPVKKDVPLTVTIRQ